ncbi:uncharacterized protein LOC104905751 [Beta vulgaris subsp. vulgaris]|uniref:uncharacterized protein LOC104905751 n=1 Tax=Beta vulgaris subsp. vulgaris TaxID=3555 RepID=UPI00053F7ACF|nr:uncharacterized protein LOC104905751 [Beta vulgaris subsp. vulgaris]
MLEDTISIPPATIIDECGVSILNTQFCEYLRVDQQMESWIFATLSRDVFVEVHDLSTSVKIWNRLQTRFMHASMDRSMELKGRLTRIKKSDSQSVDGYLCEIKVIADSLAIIQCPISNQDLVQHKLFGLNLDSKYDHIVTILLHYPFPLSFDDLCPKLLLHEQRMKSSKDGFESSSQHALVVVQSSGSSPKPNSGGRNRGRNNKNRGGNNNRNQNNRGNGGGNGG